MYADKFEKAINYKPLSARAKHVGTYLRLKIFFTCREGIVTLFFINNTKTFLPPFEFAKVKAKDEFP